MKMKILAAVLSLAPLGFATAASAQSAGTDDQSSQSGSESQNEKMGSVDAKPLGDSGLEQTEGQVVSATPHTLTLTQNGQQFTVKIGNKTDFVRDGQIVPGSQLREGQDVRAALAEPSSPYAVAIEISPSPGGSAQQGGTSAKEQGAQQGAAEGQQHKCCCKAGGSQGATPSQAPSPDSSGSSGSGY